MAEFASLNALNCPNCGAPLEFAAGRSVVRCGFCGSHIERSQESPTPADGGHALRAGFVDGRLVVEQPSKARRFVIKMQAGQPVVIESGGPAGPVQTTLTPVQPEVGRRLGYLLVLFILLVTIVPISCAMLNTARVGSLFKSIASGQFGQALTAVPTLNKNIRLGGSATFAPSISDAPPDIVALSMQFPAGGGERENRLVALSSASPSLLWQSQSLGQDVYSAPLWASSEMVYALIKDHLLAFHRADGSLAWDCLLPDQVSLNICPNCVCLVGERIFTLSDDGTLQALDARTGAPLWDFRAIQDSPRGLYLLGPRLAFMDRDEDNHGLLRVFDPTSGEMLTAQPTCVYSDWPEYADWTTPLYLEPSGSSFYLAFGSPQLCVQRWDAGKLTQDWNTPVSNLLRYDEDTPPLITKEALYAGAGQQLVALDAASGELRVLLDDADYEFVPLAVEGDGLLVRAVRQRGTRRFELWVVDKANGGEALWSFDLGQNLPIDPPDANTSIIDVDKPAWTWRAVPGGLAVLSFERAEDDASSRNGGSHAVRIETLDWQTGVSLDVKQVRLGVETSILSVPGWMAWERGWLWMSVEGSLLALDPVAGAITYRWP
ncbi:MAG: PQQ-like beta-propeller repeat protein [Thermoflexales bacterium]|nr:PQQ-like beta-propeller repeat protein [Thermoflexales bacterium]